MLNVHDMKKAFLMPLLATLLFCGCQQSMEERAANEARTYTQKNCPLQLSEQIVMDSMTFDAASHTFGYHYRMTGSLDNDSAIDKPFMRQQLGDALRNLTSLQAYKDEGYSFRYVYRSASHPDHILLEELFTREDY